MELRGALTDLHNLLDPGTIIALHGGISLEELQLLARVELEIKKLNDKPTT